MARSRYHRFASAGSGVAKGVGRRLAALAAATTAAGQLLPASVGLAAPREGFGSTPGSVTSPSAAASSSSTQNSGGLVLKVSRQSSGVALIIEGTGPSPQLVQSSSSNGWQAQLTTAAAMALQQGPQRLSLPEFGLSQVTLTGGGNSFQLDVLPAQGLPLARPVISADGKNLIVTFAAASQPSLQTLRPNLNQPGTVPQATYAPPLQPRAVAPPLGDMAIGTMMLRNSSFINLRGPRITMTLRNASAKDALMSLARIGGYGFVYVDETIANQTSSTTTPATVSQVSGMGTTAVPDAAGKVNIAFANEDYSRAVNAVLLAVGLSARLEGNLIIAGKGVIGKSFGARLSKVFRLNQVSPDSAADYLANLGASVTKTNTITTAVSTGTTQNNAVQNAPSASTTTSAKTTSVETYGSSIGPLLGLQATTDSRLGTITLIGNPEIVSIAEQYLKQLDLRQRQVALTVRILDVTLGDQQLAKNTFLFRGGNSFILNDTGEMSLSFGSFFTQRERGVQQNEFMDQFNALIESSSTKVLASPTMILGESSASSGGDGIGRSKANEGLVTVGETVITNFSTDAASGAQNPATVTACKATFTQTGLQLGARVTKIDDNGFITFSMSPKISAPVPGGFSPNCGPFFNVLERKLDTGSLRVRDGQTLVLTGVISENTRATVRKWPIVGDLPFIGQFFRQSGVDRSKSELIIMVTPKILYDDVPDSGYGYIPNLQESKFFVGGS